MITRKSRDEIKMMKIAGEIVALAHQTVKKSIEPGISTKELDAIVAKVIKDNKAIPTFLGYSGYPASICASINEQVVHGIPSEKTILQEGDIISIDIGATFRGLVGDSAWTYPVGKISEEKERLLEYTEKSLFKAIEKMVAGNTLDDVGGAIEDVAVANNLGIVREYGGHGVGHSMHEEPFVFHYRTGNKTILKPNMTIAVEPMLNLGKDAVFQLDDGWTVCTVDSQPSAHFEHTILITDSYPEILTMLHNI